MAGYLFQNRDNFTFTYFQMGRFIWTSSDEGFIFDRYEPRLKYLVNVHDITFYRNPIGSFGHDKEERHPLHAFILWSLCEYHIEESNLYDIINI